MAGWRESPTPVARPLGPQHPESTLGILAQGWEEQAELRGVAFPTCDLPGTSNLNAGLLDENLER